MSEDEIVPAADIAAERPRFTIVSREADSEPTLQTELERLQEDLQETKELLEHSEQQREQLTGALVSNRRIGAALGIIMTIQRISLDEAFEVLSAASQATNRKVKDIAEDVIYTGEVKSSLGR